MDRGQYAMTSGKRKHRRQAVRIKANIVDTAGLPVGTCVMANVSVGGAKLTQLESIEVPDKFVLVLAGDGTVRRQCDVVWRLEKEIGVKFI